MIVSAHQPSYYPWIGWLHKVAKSDLFILMDEVQLADRAFQHRNIFLTKEGNIKYLTIPIEKKNYREKNICDLKINNNINWQQQHLNFITENYRKHPFFKEVLPEIEELYTKDYDLLIDVLKDNIKLVLKLCNISTQVVFQSDLNYDRSKYKNELILELVKAGKGTTYLSGQGAKSYLEEHDFNQAGIDISFQKITHPEYKQLHSQEFTLGMSTCDLLFNLGIEGTQELLKELVK